MRALTVLLLAALVSAALCDGGADTGKQLIMLEIERLNYPGEQGTPVVKRQTQVEYSSSEDQRQVPPEYLSLLQQLSPQEQQPREVQQVFITRNPQEAYSQFSQQPPQAPLPPRPRLTPEQEQMRRLQEAAANKHIREQQQRALQLALQTGQFQTGFQLQSPYQPQPQSPFQPQPQPQPQQYEDRPQPQFQYESPSSFGPGPEPQYSQPQRPSEYYQQTRSIRPAQVPKRFSYSQVQFGTSELAREALAPRLDAVQQRLQSQAKAQLEYYSPEPQGQEDYSVQPQQQTPTLPQHPQQYLIETTRPAEQTEEPIVRIPRPRPPPPSQSLYYRPESVTPSAPNSFYSKAPEQYTVPKNYQAQYSSVPQYGQRPQEDIPSKSAYYVQQAGISKRVSSQQVPVYNSYPSYSSGVPRIPTAQGHRPLTASEMKALSKAGFQISPLSLNSLQDVSEITPSYEDNGGDDVYRGANSKRQSLYVDETKPPGKYPKRIPKPVPLTETERRLLAEQGIRNLYRVETAESKDSPVTYVLAIDNAVMMRQSETARQP